MLRRRHTPLIGACAVTLLAALAGCGSGSPAAAPSASVPTPTPSTSGPPASTATPTASGPTAPTPTGSTGSTAPTTPPQPTTPAGPGTVSLSFADSGKTVHLTVGQHLHVVLRSTYWSFQAVRPPAVLRQDGSGTATPATPCSGPPGSGLCGARTADFTAVGAGRATVVATRMMCGEAMRCVGANGRFVAYVDVT